MHELNFEWELSSPTSNYQFAAQILKTFYSESNTILMSKTSILNKEFCFDFLIKLNNNTLSLNARMLNIDELFKINTETNQLKTCFRQKYFEYYLNIKHLLTSNNVPYQVIVLSF
jgi:hypothetical protein